MESATMDATAPVSAPRRLKGHKATVTCCAAARDRPGVIATTGEDGCICLFDLRCKDVQRVMELGTDPVSSLCFKPGHEDAIYAASEAEIRCLDLRMATSEKPLERYSYNKEEINQISCNLKSSFLAAADDSGDVKIIDIRHQHPYKTLRAVHTSICSSVQFLPWRPWEAVTGGLDSKLVMWDFSKGRPLLVVDFGTLENGGTKAVQCYNPAFVHSIAVPELDMVEKLGKVCAVARGDGVVSLIDIEAELAKSKGSVKPQKGSQTKSKGDASAADVETREKRLHLDYSMGGHTASTSCVAFSVFGERGKFIISGGNDKAVKVWDWLKYLDDAQTCVDKPAVSTINLQKKVNWLCSTPLDSDNLVVCDTTKVVKVYSVC